MRPIEWLSRYCPSGLICCYDEHNYRPGQFLEDGPLQTDDELSVCVYVCVCVCEGEGLRQWPL